jgi:hypothetical protein
MYLKSITSFLNRFALSLLAGSALMGGLSGPVVAQSAPTTNHLIVSRIQYDGNTFGNPTPYPYIFADPTVTGIQGSIHLDEYKPFAGTPVVVSLPLIGITTSFSSKSEGALMRSADGNFLSYMGYDGPDGSEGVSNSETPGAQLVGNTAPTYNREVALISHKGVVTLQDETNAYSGDNPRAVISVDGTQFYMAGNADSSLNPDGTGPGTTIGARYGILGSDQSYQLGVYVATDRPDESSKQHRKDNNFRAIGIFNGDLYVAKGSGGNGDDGVFQVGTGLPTGTSNTITELLGAPATDPVTGNASPLTPFGFWFADPSTLYVADEGYANLDGNGNLIPDPLAGLQKWSLINGTWTMDYVIQAGLNLFQPVMIDGYPVATYTTGIRNLDGRVNKDGTVTIYAITAQYSSISGGEPDPTSLVEVKDVLAATTLPTGRKYKSDETFTTLQNSGVGEVFRGVSIARLAIK